MPQDATLDINFYEDIFSSMARPAHLEAVKQCVGMFAREAVGTAMAGGSRPGSPERPTRRGRWAGMARAFWGGAGGEGQARTSVL